MTGAVAVQEGWVHLKKAEKSSFTSRQTTLTWLQQSQRYIRSSGESRVRYTSPCFASNCFAYSRACFVRPGP